MMVVMMMMSVVITMMGTQLARLNHSIGLEHRVPLTFAYFFTFLAAPVLNSFEFRPMVCGQTILCNNTEPDPLYVGHMRQVTPCYCSPPSHSPSAADAAAAAAAAAAVCSITAMLAVNLRNNHGLRGGRYKSGFRRSIMGSRYGGIYDCLTTCKFPHLLTVLATILLFGAVFSMLTMVVLGELNKLFSDEIFMEAIDSFGARLNSKASRPGWRTCLRSQSDGRIAARKPMLKPPLPSGSQLRTSSAP